MTLLDALREFDVEPTTEVTVVETNGVVRSSRRRSPDDSKVERIVLKPRRGGPACFSRAAGTLLEPGEVHFFGQESWDQSNLMLMAWAGTLRRGEDDLVTFVVRFYDGTTLEGSLNIRKRSDRDLAAHCRRVESFRKAFCPGLSAKQATPMFNFFLSNYSVPSAA